MKAIWNNVVIAESDHTEMVENKALKPILDQSNYTLETVQAAYDAIANSKTKGKVVVSIT